MNFKKHYDLEGKHAYLGASKYHWLNYSEEKLEQTYKNFLATQRGTELHDLAATCIRLGQKLPRSNITLNSYVNDAIGYRMTPEVVLYYSSNCFGTADAISFNKNMLRIHDLKTGVIPAKMEQLKIYATLFCLEYAVEPSSIKIELRIYQNDEILVYEPHPQEIVDISKLIIKADSIINRINEEAFPV